MAPLGAGGVDPGGAIVGISWDPVPAGVRWAPDAPPERRRGTRSRGRAGEGMAMGILGLGRRDL